jgi:hypothetical protein
MIESTILGDEPLSFISNGPQGYTKTASLYPALLEIWCCMVLTKRDRIYRLFWAVQDHHPSLQYNYQSIDITASAPIILTRPMPK